MRLCILGDSHIAALKHALDENPGLASGAEVTFWGLPWARLLSVRYENGCYSAKRKEELLARMSGGKHQTLRPSDFDALVFHGVQLDINHVLFSLRSGNRRATDYSTAFRQEMLSAHLKATFLFSLLCPLVGSFQGRLAVSPMPLISEESHVGARLEISAEDLEVVHSSMESCLAALGVQFIAQDERTICQNKYTKKEFSIGSARLAKTRVLHPIGEHKHMNAAFGALALARILARLGESKKTEPIGRI